ncbi:MAG: FKBP-type peptidyl-prolyl cis-trans isomerase, partial [Cyanobacteria bacterium J06649_5]
MVQAKSGDTVKVHYTGTLNNGQVFDSSKEREPLEFTLGKGMVIPGFEAAVSGLAVGESVTKTIPVDEAYGPYNKDMVADIEK